MWKKIIVAGTISVALLGGTALAVASNGSPATRATTDRAPETQSHWSQMSDYLGEDWSGMVDSMKDVLGDRFGDMEELMRSVGPDMDWSDMEEFMDGTDMEEFMDGTDMEEFMDGNGMGDLDTDWSDMQDFDMGDAEDFMGGSGMGGSHMGGADAGGFMGQSNTSGYRSGFNA